MTGWLPAPVEELFGTEATADESYDVLTVDVPPAAWISALETARGELGCTYFDWLSAVDEPGTGFRVSAHVVALAPVRRLLVRTTVPHDAPVLPSAVEVYAGAAWHERETHEMFGVTFEGHPGLDPLLLPEGFEGHPLRKDFVLASRVAKAWPGAKEPGESEHGGPKRRQMLPPGVPDPNEWGPLKGQLPPAPARPARGAGRAAGERPVRRARTAGEGSASQAATGSGSASAGAAPASAAAAGATPSEGSAPQEARPAARRARTASEGSATQRTESAAQAPGAGAAPGPETTGIPEAAPTSGTEPTHTPTPPRRARSAGGGSASQREATPAPTDEPGDQPARPASTRGTDAPWHHARPAFDDAEQKPPTGEPPPERQTPPERQSLAGEESASGEQPAAAEQPTPEPATPADSAPKRQEPESPTESESPTEPEDSTDPDSSTDPASHPKTEPASPPKSEAPDRPETPETPDARPAGEDTPGGPQ